MLLWIGKRVCIIYAYKTTKNNVLLDRQAVLNEWVSEWMSEYNCKKQNKWVRVTKLKAVCSDSDYHHFSEWRPRMTVAPPAHTHVWSGTTYEVIKPVLQGSYWKNSHQGDDGGDPGQRGYLWDQLFTQHTPCMLKGKPAMRDLNNGLSPSMSCN